MANIAKKIYVDNFEVLSTIINALTLVDGEDIDFSINKDSFEQWCDQNEMREWCNETYSYQTECMSEDNGTTPWADVYDNMVVITGFLMAYIQNLYDMELMNIEAPLKQITNSYKKAI